MPWIINNNIKVTVEFEPESNIKVCVVRDGKLVVVKSSEVFSILAFHREEKIIGDGGRSGQGWGQTTDPSGLGASLLLTQVCHNVLANVLIALSAHHYDVYFHFQLILCTCQLSYSQSQSLPVRSGGCFVMTANLDGETNLKPLTAPKWEKFQQFGILKELLIFHLDFAFLGNFVFEFFLSTGKLGSSSRPRASDSWKPRLQFSNKVFNDYTQYNHFEHLNYLAIWI